MINNVVLVGRITNDLELLKTQSGISYVRFTLAVNRSFANQSGEREADFISCVAWRGQAENLVRFMRKGSQIGVEGRIQTGSYDTDQGRRYTTDIVADSITFLESRNQQQESSQRNPQSDYFEQMADEFVSNKDFTADDDLPF